MACSIDIFATGAARIVWTRVVQAQSKRPRTERRRGKYLHRSGHAGKRTRSVSTALVLLDGRTEPQYVPTSELRRETVLDILCDPEIKLSQITTVGGKVYDLDE